MYFIQILVLKARPQSYFAEEYYLTFNGVSLMIINIFGGNNMMGCSFPDFYGWLATFRKGQNRFLPNQFRKSRASFLIRLSKIFI